MSENTLVVILYLLLDPRLLTSDLCLSLQACENGRGAILLSVARGKVSEGIDFGKCWILSRKRLCRNIQTVKAIQQSSLWL